MRTIVTGASGFVGSNIAKVLADRHGDTVIGDRVDMTDRAAVRGHVDASEADAIVHCAILNDWARMNRDRELAWAAYVESTRTYADAANERGIPFCLVSTDWVFDGSSPPAPAGEDEPPSPINAYGFLKAASELVVAERAERGSVARISGVQGLHRARPQAPRRQDAGFGYLVASIVDALRAGRRFSVWRGEQIDRKSTR